MIEAILGTITPYGHGVVGAVLQDFYCGFYLSKYEEKDFDFPAITITEDDRVLILGIEFPQLSEDLQYSKAYCNLMITEGNIEEENYETSS